MSVAVNSSSRGLNNPGSWKRKTSDDEDERQGSAKQGRYSWYITLENESPVPTDEDEESVHTMQGEETEFAKDTSDTSDGSTQSGSVSDSSNSDSEISVHVEYELDSQSENENNIVNLSSSSDPENFVRIQIITVCDSDGQADNSDASQSSFDAEIMRADFRFCIQCKNRNSNPLYRYCEKCYQLRKSDYPRYRPRRKPRALNKTICTPSSASKISTQELCEMDSGLASSQCELDSALGSSQEVDKPLNIFQNNLSQSEIYALSKADGNCESQTDYEHSINNDVLSQESGLASSQDLNKPFSDSQSSEVQSGCSGMDRTKETTIKSNIETESGRDVDSLSILSKNSQSIKEDNASWDSPCLICTTSRRNSGFVHGKIMHVCCCYPCAIKVWSSNGNRCPICNRKVSQIPKAFF